MVSFDSKKAQAVAQYLITVGVVVVMGVMAIGLISTLTSNESGSSSKASKLFWQSRDIAITDAAVDVNGYGLFVFQNNSSDPVKITSMIVDGTDHSIPDANQVTLLRTSKFRYLFSSLPPCTQLTRTYKVSISYINTSSNLSKSTQTNDLTVDCGFGGGTVGGIGSIVALFIGPAYSGGGAISDGSGNWVTSGTTTTGIVFPQNDNNICFGGEACQSSIDYNGTDLIFNSN
jgi:hypothetical protein